MRLLTIQIAPFIVGALIGLGFGIGVTRHGSWPNVQYRILEMEPIARNLSLVGLLLLGSGSGCVLATILRITGYGDFEFAPKDNDKFAWQSFSVTISLVLSGLLFLAIGIYILS
jgi:hypothetical protein